MAFSSQANYTSRTAASGRRGKCPLLLLAGIAWSVHLIPTAVNLVLLDRGYYFCIQVAPQLSSRGCVYPIPNPLLLRKSGITEIEPETSGSVGRNCDH
jgi:hypothetical protein